jgi:hypothetical protein
MTQLDEASMRRFDLKANFQYLKSEQAVKLFKELCNKLSIDCSDLAVKAVSQLGLLTPGDFANLLRQSRLNPIKDSMELFVRLKAEMCHKKSMNVRPIGFLANAA